jgi:Primase C terminal 1 (PriCT-1)/Family of unknown function (DUF5906)
MSTAPTTFFEVAARLEQNGYRVVPIAPGLKHPGFADWQKFSYSLGCETSYPQYGAGILAESTPGVDIDVADEEIVSIIEKMVRNVVGLGDDAQIPHRIGRWPRLLLPFRTDKPFKKKQSALYKLDFAPNEKASKVEILACGQQWVGYHIHPDTKEAYRYNGTDLLSTPRAELPLLTEEMASRIIAEAEEILGEYGQRIEELSNNINKNESNEHGKIYEGGRNTALTSMAGTMRRKGMTQAAMEAALLTQNAATCSPPLPEKDVRAIAKSVSRYEPESDEIAQETQNALPAVVGLSDFLAYMQPHQYIFIPDGSQWPASSVDNRLPRQKVEGRKRLVKASEWLDQRQPVEQMTWAPCEPQLIPDKLIVQGGWILHPGCRVFNLYRPPPSLTGDRTKAGMWRAHLQRIYPDEYEHIEHWLAHRVQRPGEKINHALVLQGGQGIGKDTLLEPVKWAIGSWNWSEISAQQMLGSFNPWCRAVIVRVNEARDLGEFNRYAFYDHSKVYMAAPPDVIRVNAKFTHEYYIPNVMGIIITTNHDSDGIYLDPDDRRHFVAGSDAKKEDFDSDYWKDIWEWYSHGGGIGHVAAYLRTLELSGFNPKAPPPKTAAFWRIVHSNAAPEDAGLADILESLCRPNVLTLQELADAAKNRHMHEVADFLTSLKTRRMVQHRMKAVGYVVLTNQDAESGLWSIGGRRQTVYMQRGMSYRDGVAAMRKRYAVRQ